MKSLDGLLIPPNDPRISQKIILTSFDAASSLRGPAFLHKQVDEGFGSYLRQGISIRGTTIADTQKLYRGFRDEDGYRISPFQVSCQSTR